MDLEQRVIEVTEIVQGDEIKLKDKFNKTYNIRKKKNDGNDTFAFVSYIKMGGGDINGKLVDIRFDRYTNKHGTKSRGIKMIEWAKPLEQPLKEVVEEVRQATLLEETPTVIVEPTTNEHILASVCTNRGVDNLTGNRMLVTDHTEELDKIMEFIRKAHRKVLTNIVKTRDAELSEET